jgi:hypothetical protein
MTKGTKFKLPSASKAGMQKKQGRNFLLPKEKPKRGMIPRPPMPKPEDFPNFKRPKPMPKPMPRPGDPLRPKRMSGPPMRYKLSPAEIRMIDNYRKKKARKK